MKFKIYFAASIRGGRDDVEIYQSLIEHLKSHGQVLTEHIGNRELPLMGEDGLTNSEIHDRDMNWLGKSNVVVAEVTKASLGAGYEIGRIVERNLWVPESQRKNILCLYRPQIGKMLSAMISGSKGLKNIEYRELDEAKIKIDDFFRGIKNQ